MNEPIDQDELQAMDENNSTWIKAWRNTMPHVVPSDEFKFFSRLRARLGSYPRFGNLYLSYCKHHKTYFLDLEHTNHCIRCPICEKKWLSEQQARLTK